MCYNRKIWVLSERVRDPAAADGPCRQAFWSVPVCWRVAYGGGWRGHDALYLDHFLADLCDIPLCICPALIQTILFVCWVVVFHVDVYMSV